MAKKKKKVYEWTCDLCMDKLVIEDIDGREHLPMNWKEYEDTHICDDCLVNLETTLDEGYPLKEVKAKNATLSRGEKERIAHVLGIEAEEWFLGHL